MNDQVQGLAPVLEEKRIQRRGGTDTVGIAETHLTLLGRVVLKTLSRDCGLDSLLSLILAHDLGRLHLGSRGLLGDRLCILHNALDVGHAAHERRQDGVDEVVSIEALTLRRLVRSRYRARSVLLAVRASLQIKNSAADTAVAATAAAAVAAARQQFKKVCTATPKNTSVVVFTVCPSGPCMMLMERMRDCTWLQGRQLLASVRSCSSGRDTAVPCMFVDGMGMAMGPKRIVMMGRAAASSLGWPMRRKRPARAGGRWITCTRVAGGLSFSSSFIAVMSWPRFSGIPKPEPNSAPGRGMLSIENSSSLGVVCPATPAASSATADTIISRNIFEWF